MASRTLISSGSAFEAQIGYSRAVVSGEWIFVSGCTGFDYATGQLATGGVAEQADQALRNVADALAQAGARMEDVVRVRYILPRRDLFPATWPVLRRWFGDVRPAATMIEAGLMEEAMLFEVEATARKASSTGPGQARTEGRAEGDATAAVSLP